VTKSTARRFLPPLVLVVLLGALAEGLSWVVAERLHVLGVLYDPEGLEGYEEYLRERDPTLGWPAPMRMDPLLMDSSGSRPVPAFPEVGRACVSLYGDSFTYGAEVDHEHAWSNVLSLLLGCRVANYGVGGYGSDQATLRFELNTDDEAPVVVLGHLSENILRNVNRFRTLLYSESRWGFKPRFVLDTPGGLELLPMPTPAPDQLQDFLLHPERHLADEYFVPGGDSGLSHMSFPYTLSVLRALGHFHVRSELLGEPWFTDFYRPDHPSQGLEITARILERFVATAGSRGKAAVLVLIPTGLDLEYFEDTGE